MANCIISGFDKIEENKKLHEIIKNDDWDSFKNLDTNITDEIFTMILYYNSINMFDKAFDIAFGNKTHDNVYDNTSINPGDISSAVYASCNDAMISKLKEKILKTIDRDQFLTIFQLDLLPELIEKSIAYHCEALLNPEKSGINKQQFKTAAKIMSRLAIAIENKDLQDKINKTLFEIT